MTRKEAARLLGIDPSSSKAAINKAFRKKSKDIHPDKNPVLEELFKELVNARDRLLDSTPDKPDYNDKYDFSQGADWMSWEKKDWSFTPPEKKKRWSPPSPSDLDWLPRAMSILVIFCLLILGIVTVSKKIQSNKTKYYVEEYTSVYDLKQEDIAPYYPDAEGAAIYFPDRPPAVERFLHPVKEQPIMVENVANPMERDSNSYKGSIWQYIDEIIHSRKRLAPQRPRHQLYYHDTISSTLTSPQRRGGLYAPFNPQQAGPQGDLPAKEGAENKGAGLSN